MPIKFGTRDEPDYEVYLHRIGRAGRFGRKGNFVSVLHSKIVVHTWSVLD